MEKPIYLDPVRQNTLMNHLLAPFFPRYRVLLELEREPAHLRVPLRNLILSHDHRLLFLRNQKCACTQTTQLLYAYANGGKTYPGNVHRANRGILPGRYRWPEIKPVFEAHGAYLFTFVRHPETRVHSAFRNFFVDQKNIARHKHMTPMLAHGYDPARSDSYNFDVFLDYVGHSFEVDRCNTDSHWRLQTDNIAWSDIRFDFVGRTERYAADIRKVFDQVGASEFSPEALLGQRFNASGAMKSGVSAAQRARIEALYAPDYHAFGY
ncbi:MAG: sulfotransferase family 2 domain-containing protein [Pseudorhodobacter sp.]|nr:sulfotransferase family 2 domain-containing protein [Pseudorhodobacter sp.]